MIRFIAVKQAIRFEGKQDLQTEMMIALFGLFALPALFRSKTSSRNAGTSSLACTSSRLRGAGYLSSNGWFQDS